MDFWNDLGLMFFLGMIFIPRLVLIYYGFIAHFSITPIIGFMIAPRVFLASILTPVYWDTNPIAISVFWALAVILDILGLVMNYKMSSAMWAQQLEAYRERMSSRYY